jgi:hypothetical protein
VVMAIIHVEARSIITTVPMTMTTAKMEPARTHGCRSVELVWFDAPGAVGGLTGVGGSSTVAIPVMGLRGPLAGRVSAGGTGGGV